MEEGIRIGLAIAVQKTLIGTPIGQEEALENLLLKKKCLMLSATNAEKDAKFLSSQRARSQFIAAIVSEKVTGLNQEELAQLIMILQLSTRNWIGFWMR